jgi:hypothetical protein
MSANLHIEDYQKKPFPFVVYEAGRDIYTSIAALLSTIGEFILILIGLVTSPLWVTILYFLLIRSRKKARKGFEIMVAEWKDAPRSADMFDILEYIMRFKQNMERDTGEFHMPKRFRIFRLFFVEIRRFYRIYDELSKWLEQKVYPSAEELGIPLEDIEFMKSQMTKEDYKDLRDPDWIPFEKRCLLN